MQNNLAPIGVSTYSRLQHLQQTISALQNNMLAKDSELYIFSDAAKVGDEEKVLAVRSYISKIDGFKTVNIIERSENNRVANNRGGMRMLLSKYGRMIFLEEDIVTAPNFLTYMNDALNFYKDNPKVFAINAYTPPITIPSTYSNPVVMLPRFAAWGFGIWKEKFDEIVMDITLNTFQNLISNKKELNGYCIGGDDVITQLWLQANGYIDALDVRIDYSMFVKGRQYVACPTKSLAHTVGCDGSGEHWVRATDKYKVDLSESMFYLGLEDSSEPDGRILRLLSEFNKLTFMGRLIKLSMYIGLYPLLYRFRKVWNAITFLRNYKL